METQKIGALIRQLRREIGYTQAELAEKMQLSDRTISKWERGVGCPDISLLPQLSDIFGVDIKEILDGELKKNTFVAGNLRNNHYFVCPDCGNVLISTGDASSYCCGKKLVACTKQKPDVAHELTVEEVENDWYITSFHPMLKEHYISFIVFVTGDKLNMTKCYPEWNLQCRIPKREHGTLIWYCNKHGLFYKNI